MKTLPNMLLLLSLSAPLFAAQVTPPPPPPSEPEKSIKNNSIEEEITVTGQRLTSPVIGSDTTFGALGERAVLDTPFSVASFTEELIRATAAITLKDIMVRDPSATSDVNAGRL